MRNNVNQSIVMDGERNHHQEVFREKGYILTDQTKDFQNNKENGFKCETCGKIYTQKNHLDEHIRVHVVEKLFECEVDVNKETPVVEKRFECEVCGKSFTKKVNLENHTRIQTDEKPFECQVCGERFTQKTNLVSHTRTHTGEKPFECQVCGKI